MADSKWTDLWAIANWEDEDQTVLLSHVWDDLKAAADERVAFAELSHDSGFTAANTFPDFNNDKSLFLASANSPNNARRISNACLNGGFAILVKTGDVTSTGTATTNADIPEAFFLADVLDAVGYTGETAFQHMTDTTNGTAPALARAYWYVQWYKVMNYQTWFNALLKTAPGWVSSYELSQYTIDVEYAYDTDPEGFAFATADETTTLTGPADVYSTNDLNETAPFSTPQEVRDYTIGIFNNRNDDYSGTPATTTRIGTLFDESAQQSAAGNKRAIITCKIFVQKIRFKVIDSYRAISPNRFEVPIYFYGYYSADSVSGAGTPTFADFALGVSEDDRNLELLTKDGSDYYYLDVSGLDYDDPSVVTVPSVPASGIDTNSQSLGIIKRPMTADNEISNIDDDELSVYVKPNLTDGTGWEYYTPAP